MIAEELTTPTQIAADLRSEAEYVRDIRTWEAQKRHERLIWETMEAEAMRRIDRLEAE